jgi:hypothetical protein
MTVRGTTTPQERIFGTLPYLLPMVEALVFGSFFFKQFPQVGAVIITVLYPVIALYSAFPLMGLIIFFALFMLVVRNENLPHFIRFNTLQAIMLMICLSICKVLLFSVIGPLIGLAILPGLQVAVAGPAEFLMEILFNFIFFGVFAAAIYSIVQVIRGHYPDIPTLSEMVYMQVR